MQYLQENFYLPDGMYGNRKQNQRENDQAAFKNRDRLENNDQFIKIIDQQSLSQDQIEISKRAKEFEDKFGSLSKSYQFSDSKDIKQFLLRNKFLFSALKEIPDQIYNYFGDNQKLSLKVSYEPDSFGYSDLLVEILTELSAQEAMPLLDKFDEKWWLENMDRVNGKLNITLKFV